jgi:hypothetical protein
MRRHICRRCRLLAELSDSSLSCCLLQTTTTFSFCALLSPTTTTTAKFHCYCCVSLSFGLLVQECTQQQQQLAACLQSTFLQEDSLYFVCVSPACGARLAVFVLNTNTIFIRLNHYAPAVNFHRPSLADA